MAAIDYSAPLSEINSDGGGMNNNNGSVLLGDLVDQSLFFRVNDQSLKEFNSISGIYNSNSFSRSNLNNGSRVDKARAKAVYNFIGLEV